MDGRMNETTAMEGGVELVGSWRMGWDFAGDLLLMANNWLVD